jgi:uncharacterized SAM-binding protein YcdF (DUF218 family)
MFLLKKMVGPLLFPVSLCLEILLLGLLLLWGTRRQKAGKILVSLGTGLLLLLSYPWLPEKLLSPLEQWYPHLAGVDRLPRAASGQEPVKWVVVLGGNVERTTEGVRLYRQLPGAKLVLSGGGVFGAKPGATESARIGLILGINPADLVLESRPLDTEEEARLLKSRLGADRFILVTSAAHMPRAMALFNKLGLNPIAAPTDYLVEDRPLNPRSFFPDVRNLVLVDTATYEYLGWGWAWLRGKI